MEHYSRYFINNHRYRTIPHHFKFISVIIVFLLSLYSGILNVRDSIPEIVFVKQVQAVNFSKKNFQPVIIEDKATLVLSVEIADEKKELPKTTIAPTINLDDTNTKVNNIKDENNGKKAENSPSENTFFTALNAYRQKNGKPSLSWDEKLAEYAQNRAEIFKTSGGLDSHAGFNDYIQNQDGFKKLGFLALGENSGYGLTQDAEYIVEEVYGKSPSHNENQLNSKWSHVGIGASDTATNFIFGGDKD